MNIKQKFDTLFMLLEDTLRNHEIVDEFKEVLTAFAYKIEAAIKSDIDPREKGRLCEDFNDVVINIKYLSSQWTNHEGYACSSCGMPEVARYTCGKQMRERRLCFGCNHWENVAGSIRDGKKKLIIVNHGIYSDGGRQSSDRSFLGHAGREFKIQKLDNGETFTTNNLWSGGMLPQKYWDEFPDTHKFVKD